MAHRILSDDFDWGVLKVISSCDTRFRRGSVPVMAKLCWYSLFCFSNVNGNRWSFVIYFNLVAILVQTQCFLPCLVWKRRIRNSSWNQNFRCSKKLHPMKYTFLRKILVIIPTSSGIFVPQRRKYYWSEPIPIAKYSTTRSTKMRFLVFDFFFTHDQSDNSVRPPMEA